jgi:predicted nucleic acid-binding protein
MQRIIVSDTSCLILLDKIGHISLLHTLFDTITITSLIAEEFGKELPNFIRIEDPKDKNYQKILEGFLDPGESSAIALALESDDCLLIIDESKGRREANQLKLNVTGTLGILIVAKEKGLINSLTEVIGQINQTDFRISQSLINEAKRKSNE